MEKPWYRKLFSRPQNPVPEVAPATADFEDANVQFNMGLKFANEGAARDYARAAEWYRKAADQSHSLAQFNLGMMYANGQGVTKNDAESAVWFGKAAQQGDAGAQFNMGRSFHQATFTEVREDAAESRIEAYKWYTLAAAQGYKRRDSACTTLILSMSREDVADGDKRVAAFQVQNPSPSHT